MSLNEFLYMGGYAFYVWTSYAIALIILILNVVMPMMQHKKLLKQIINRLRRDRGRV